MNNRNRRLPGPWKAVEIEPEDKDWAAWEVWSGDDAVATTVIGRSNAILIATAPELLNALSTAVQQNGFDSESLAKAKEIIANAKEQGDAV